MAEAAAGGGGLKVHNNTTGANRLKGRSNMNLANKNAGTTLKKSESDDDSLFDDDFGGEVPTYKKAIREQYERAINNYAQDSEFYKKNF